MDGEFSIVRGPGEGEFEFRFKEVYPDDAGRYKFRATNNDGECEATASLSVIPAEGTPPEFVTKPRSREVFILSVYRKTKVDKVYTGSSGDI